MFTLSTNLQNYAWVKSTFTRMFKENSPKQICTQGSTSKKYNKNQTPNKVTKNSNYPNENPKGDGCPESEKTATSAKEEMEIGSRYYKEKD